MAYQEQPNDYEHSSSITEKGLSTLKNGGTFWLFSFILVAVLGLYVKFFIGGKDNVLSRQTLKIANFVEFKLNYVVFLVLVWFSLFFFAVFN